MTLRISSLLSWFLIIRELEIVNRLELWRLHADLILCYKIAHGYVSLSPDSFFTVVRDHRTRGHSLNIFMYFLFIVLSDARVNCRKHFFAVRVINVYGTVYLMKSFPLTSYRGSKLI